MERTTWTDERLDERMAAMDHTSERIFAELAGIRDDMRSFRTEVKSEIGDLRTEMSELRRGVKTDIAELRTEVRSDIGELRTEVRRDIRELRSDLGDLGGRQDRFQDRMVQVGFGLLGVTIASIGGILIALITAGG